MATQAASSIDIRKYLFVIKRRAVLSATIFLVVVTLGVAYCLFWPPIYQASCLVLVQPQKVPTELVQATVTTKIQERLQIITQQVLSRSRLMEIIERFNLYAQMKDKLTPDELAQLMRKDISIKISQKNYFTIEYFYSDPQVVASVANALAAFFVDSNLRIREEDAVGTARFLSRESERMKGQLQEWEAKITDFKEKHLHELPDAQDKNLYILGQIQQKDSLLDHSINAERTRMDSLEKELGVEQYREQALELQRKYIEANRGGASAGGGKSQEETSSKAIRSELERLMVIYTEDHPDILRLKTHLAKAEAAEAEKNAQKAAALKAKGIQPSEGDLSPDQVALDSVRASKERIAVRIRQHQARIDFIIQERADLAAEADQVRKRIENGPAVAEQLTELTRGYEGLKTAFEKLQGKTLEANLSANLERTQRGEQFEVVDPAEVPDAPFRPSINKSVPASLGLGLALALGLSLALSFLDTSFTSVEQMERQGNFPVLVVIPALTTAAERARKRFWTTLVGAVYGVYFLFLLGMIAILVTGRGPAFKGIFIKLFQFLHLVS
ncbi:MAG: Wzz/FepE/Etk N-terminal domain-containing protein [Pseudomonadota bacterium]